MAKKKAKKTKKLVRYRVVPLCGWVCLVDGLPDEPEYRQPGPRDTIVYYEKIIQELPLTFKNLRATKRKAHELNAEWRQSPDYPKKLAEVRHFTKIRNMVTSEWQRNHPESNF